MLQRVQSIGYKTNNLRTETFKNIKKLRRCLSTKLFSAFVALLLVSSSMFLLEYLMFVNRYLCQKSFPRGLSCDTKSSMVNPMLHLLNGSATTKSGLPRGVLEKMVLLRPALVGRLGNQMFSWSAVWGLSKQLQAALGGNVSVRPVIWREAELYKLFGDHLDALVSTENELKHFKWENILESNCVYDASIFERIVKHVRDGTGSVCNRTLHSKLALLPFSFLLF